ncbi:hypothetical protein ACI7RC_15900 [Brevibacillus sp. B_LB10_24]|uniref:hypothetical protein n=1 Tax=Brevibacillus sp. B_LB10_24 TaxID=3380645 RepID=UPI0038B6DC1E
MQTDGVLESHTPQPKKKKITPIVVALILVVVVGTVAAMAMSAFKSPKAVYLSAELKGVQETTKWVTEGMDKYKQSIAPYLEKPVYTTMEISDLTIGPVPGDPELSHMLDVLKEATLSIDSAVDEKNGKKYSKVSLALKNNHLLGLEVFSDQERMGFGVPEIYNKYGIINLKDVDEFNKKYGADLPKKMMSYQDLAEAIKVDQSELLPIAAVYGKLYADSITDEQVTINKDGTFEEGGTKIPSREITVTFSDSQFKELMTKVSDTVAADEKLHDLLYKRYSNIVNLLKDNGYPIKDRDVLSKDKFVDNIKESMKDLVASMDKGDAVSGVKMVLNVDGSDRILKRTVTLTSPDKKETITMKSAKWTEGQAEKGVFQVVTDSVRGEDVDMSFSFTKETKDQTTNGSFELKIDELRDKKVEETALIKTSYKSTKDGNKESGEIDFSIGYQEDGVNQTLSGNVAAVTETTEEKRNSEYKVKLNTGELADEEELPEVIQFSLKSTEEFGKEAQFPALSKDNSLDLVNMTDSEADQVMMEAQMGAQAFMLKNMGLFQQLGLIPDFPEMY